MFAFALVNWGPRFDDPFFSHDRYDFFGRKIYLQGESVGRGPWLGLLGFWTCHCLPGSAWAYGNLAELSGQVGKRVEHQPNMQRPRPPDSPCTLVISIQKVKAKVEYIVS